MGKEHKIALSVLTTFIALNSWAVLSKRGMGDMFLLECLQPNGKSDICIGLNSSLELFNYTNNVQGPFNFNSDPSWLGRYGFVYTSTNPRTNMPSIYLGKKALTERGVAYQPQVVLEGEYKDKIIFLGSGILPNSDMSKLEIYAMNSDGTNKEIISHLDNQFHVQTVRISPKGDLLAAQIYPQGNFNEGKIAIQTLDKAAQVIDILPGVKGNFLDINFSDDGSKLAFIQVFNNHEERRIWVIDTKSHKSQQIDLYATDIDLSPDGSKLVFSTINGIYIYELDSGKTSQVVSNPGLNTQAKPYWQNGRIFFTEAFTMSTPLTAAVFSVKPDGSDRTVIAFLGVHNNALVPQELQLQPKN